MKKTGKNIACDACGEEKYFSGWYIRSQTEKGQERFFCSKVCYHGAITGRRLTDLHKQKIGLGNKGKLKTGGRYLTGSGYVMIYAPLHQLCTKDGYVREHRLIMEASLNRILGKKEIIHHINGIKDDNRIENLELFDCHSSHMAIHKNALKIKII